MSFLSIYDPDTENPQASGSGAICEWRLLLALRHFQHCGEVVDRNVDDERAFAFRGAH